MPTVGILRFGGENDFLFTAQASYGNYFNVDVYQDSDSFGLRRIGNYPVAEVTDEERILRVPDRVIFPGEDVFPLYEISERAYKDIHDPSMDLSFAIRDARDRLKREKFSRSRGWRPRRLPVVSGLQIEVGLGRYLSHTAPDGLKVHPYTKALLTAFDAGFDGRTVNGQPIVTGSLIDTGRILR